jgi:WD40 repeat protein
MSYQLIKTAELLLTFTGHKDFVKSIKVCGNRLYSASSDSLIFEWDIESGAILKTYNGHKRCVDDLALTFDGSYLFSASSDNSIIKWNASTGEQVATLLGHETSIYSIYLTSDESALWSCSADKTARRWDLETMKQDMKLVHPDYVKSATVLPNGIIATGCRDEHIRLWDPSV